MGADRLPVCYVFLPTIWSGKALANNCEHSCLHTSPSPVMHFPVLCIESNVVKWIVPLVEREGVGQGWTGRLRVKKTNRELERKREVGNYIRCFYLGTLNFFYKFDASLSHLSQRTDDPSLGGGGAEFHPSCFTLCSETLEVYIKWCQENNIICQ